MEVFLLLELVPYEGELVKGIFTSEEKAMAFLEEDMASNCVSWEFKEKRLPNSLRLEYKYQFKPDPNVKTEGVVWTTNFIIEKGNLDERWESY